MVLFGVERMGSDGGGCRSRSQEQEQVIEGPRRQCGLGRGELGTVREEEVMGHWGQLPGSWGWRMGLQLME
jgi:hypothetical protein